MDINITAVNHENQQKLRAYYESELNKEFGKNTFLSRIDFHLKNDPEGVTEIGLEIYPSGRQPIYVSCEDSSEMKAYKSALKKMRARLNKYKEQVVQNHKIK